jgi:hypothetical protein
MNPNLLPGVNEGASIRVVNKIQGALEIGIIEIERRMVGGFSSSKLAEVLHRTNGYNFTVIVHHLAYIGVVDEIGIASFKDHINIPKFFSGIQGDIGYAK